MTSAPTAWALAEVPDETLTRICLGATLYLDDCDGWARRGAAVALRLFRKAIPAGALQWATTSAICEWRHLQPSDLEFWEEALTLKGFERVRHLLWFRAVDDTNAPSYGFSYREVNDAQSQRTGFLQLVIPMTSDPAVLTQVMLAALGSGAWWSGVAGHLASWDVNRARKAFWPIHAWCRRYLGLDVQDADRMAWVARTGLPGTSWLTAVSDRLAKACGLELEELAGRRWERGVEAQRIDGGVLFRAGPRPDLFDLNLLALPEAYIEVAQALKKLLVAKPPEFCGGPFAKKKGETERWLRRFVDPTGWS